jgi:hypothetical protein
MYHPEGTKIRSGSAMNHDEVEENECGERFDAKICQDILEPAKHESWTESDEGIMTRDTYLPCIFFEMPYHFGSKFHTVRPVLT